MRKRWETRQDGLGHWWVERTPTTVDGPNDGMWLKDDRVGAEVACIALNAADAIREVCGG